MYCYNTTDVRIAAITPMVLLSVLTILDTYTIESASVQLSLTSTIVMQKTFNATQERLSNRTVTAELDSKH